MKDARHFRLTELGRRLFGVKEGADGRRMHWAQIPLDWYCHQAVLALPDSQRLALLVVGLLLVKRRVLPFDASLVRRIACLRVTPDFAAYMDHGLIELDSTGQQGDLLEERRVEEKRVGTEEQVPEPSPPAYVPPAFRAEKAIYDSRATAETKLLHTVALLAERLGRDPPGVMVEVTSYRKADGTVVKGRENPAQLGSVERVKKSLEDAEGWLADLEKKATG